MRAPMLWASCGQVRVSFGKECEKHCIVTTVKGLQPQRLRNIRRCTHKIVPSLFSNPTVQHGVAEHSTYEGPVYREDHTEIIRFASQSKAATRQQPNSDRSPMPHAFPACKDGSTPKDGPVGISQSSKQHAISESSSLENLDQTKSPS